MQIKYNHNSGLFESEFHISLYNVKADKSISFKKEFEEWN
jgi:hypothetical protein